MHRGGVLAAQVRGGEAGILQPVLTAHESRQGFELRLLYHAQRHLPAIRGDEDAGGGLAAVTHIAGAREAASRDEIRHHGRRHEGDGRVEHGDVDEFARAGAFAAQESGEDGEGRGLAGERVDHGKTHAHGVVTLLAAERHHSAGGLHDVVDGRPVPSWTVLAVTRHRAIDHPRLQGAHALVIETQARHHTRAEILEHHVGLRDEASHRLDRRWMLEIEHQRLLARVHGDEGGSHAVVAAVGSVVAHGITHARRLDLDDFRAQQSQQVRCVGAGHDMAEVDHPNPFQGSAHSPSPLQSILPLAMLESTSARA